MIYNNQKKSFNLSQDSSKQLNNLKINIFKFYLPMLYNIENV